VLPTKPPSVEYRLTKLGQSLYVALGVLLQWVEANYPTVREARRRIDEELAATG